MIQNREKYILDQLSKLKPRSKLLGIGDRDYVFIVTKIDDSNYELHLIVLQRASLSQIIL